MRTNPEERTESASPVEHTEATATAGAPLAVKPLLLLASRLSLERVGHEASIGSLGDKGMPWSHNLKAQKAEGPEQGSSVLPVLMEANEDVVSVELLLGKLEENCKTVFAPFGQRATRDLNVEAATAPHGSPGNVFGICEPGLDI